MADTKRTFAVIFELVLIFSSIFMIFLLLFLLSYTTEHVLTILQSYGNLPPDIQTEKTIRNNMLFVIAIYITIITAFIQWIVGRLRSINESYKNIKGGNHNGKRRRRKTVSFGDRVSDTTSTGNSESKVPVLARLPA